MSILVTGATGTIGSLVVQRLAAAGAQVQAFVRQPGKQRFPAGVGEAVGDLTDVASLRKALSTARTLEGILGRPLRSYAEFVGEAVTKV